MIQRLKRRFAGQPDELAQIIDTLLAQIMSIHGLLFALLLALFVLAWIVMPLLQRFGEKRG